MFHALPTIMVTSYDANEEHKQRCRNDTQAFVASFLVMALIVVAGVLGELRNNYNDLIRPQLRSLQVETTCWHHAAQVQ